MPITKARKRRIHAAKISHISLVPKGANKLKALYKEADGSLSLTGPIIKSDMEQGEILALVYAPEHRDSQGDIANAEAIKGMAHSFLKEGQGIDIRHDNKVIPKDEAYVAQSFLVAKGDERFAKVTDSDDKAVDCTGAWAVVIKLDSEELRELYRSEKWEGVSMAGSALTQEDVAAEDTPPMTEFFKALTTFMASKSEAAHETGKTEDMDKKEVEELVTKSVTDALTKALPDALAAIEKAKEDAKPKQKEVEFEGDPTDPKDLAKHLAKIELANVDMNDAKAVAKLMKRLGGKPNGEGASNQLDGNVSKSDSEGDEFLAAGEKFAKAYQEGN